MILTILVVVACLWAMTCWALFIQSRVKSRTSTPPSPTPPTTPTPPSDTVPTQMIEMMAEQNRASMQTMKDLVIDLTQGRESQSPIGTPETSLTQNENSLVYDYDSTPLPPGIEAVLAREETEGEQARLRKERDALREVLARQVRRVVEPRESGFFGNRPVDPDDGGPDVELRATPMGVSSLKSGAVSIVFHASHDESGKMADLHLLQGKRVRLAIFLESD